MANQSESITSLRQQLPVNRFVYQAPVRWREHDERHAEPKRLHPPAPQQERPRKELQQHGQCDQGEECQIGAGVNGNVPARSLRARCR